MRVADKYKPKNLSEVIYPSATVEQRIMAHASGGLSGNLMLWGPNGTSKSTVANLLPEAISGEDAIVEGKSLSVLLDQPNFQALACWRLLTLTLSTTLFRMSLIAIRSKRMNSGY